MELLIIAVIAWAAVRGMGDDTGSSRSGPAGGPRVAKYGMWDHLRDSYRDSWRRETDKLIARRDARAAGQEPPGGRWAQAQDRLADRWQQRRPPDPRPAARAPRPNTPGPGASPPASSATPTPPAAAPTPPPEPREPAPPPATDNQQQETREEAPPMTQSTSGGEDNYEQRTTKLREMIRKMRAAVDAGTAVLKATADTKAAVDAWQAADEGSADTAQSMVDTAAAMNLDQTTVAHAATAAEAMPPSQVNALMEEIELFERNAKARLAAQQAALDALEAQLAHLERTYGDAHTTVASNLGGKADFLGDGSGGGNTAAAPSPQPAAAR